VTINYNLVARGCGVKRRLNLGLWPVDGEAEWSRFFIHDLESENQQLQHLCEESHVVGKIQIWKRLWANGRTHHAITMRIKFKSEDQIGTDCSYVFLRSKVIEGPKF